jgi:A/G-specific adenine glycosylase
VGHVFTHFSLELNVAVYLGVGFDSLGEGEWWPLDQLGEAGLPTLFAKAAQSALAGTGEG